MLTPFFPSPFHVHMPTSCWRKRRGCLAPTSHATSQRIRWANFADHVPVTKDWSPLHPLHVSYAYTPMPLCHDSKSAPSQTTTPPVGGGGTPIAHAMARGGRLAMGNPLPRGYNAFQGRGPRRRAHRLCQSRCGICSSCFGGPIGATLAFHTLLVHYEFYLLTFYSTTSWTKTFPIKWPPRSHDPITFNESISFFFFILTLNLNANL